MDYGFLSPLPTIEFLLSIYSNDESNDACNRNDEYEEQSSQHLSNIFKHCINPAFEKLGKMLDVGAGTGVLVNVAKKFGWDATGIEFNKTAVEIGKKKFRINLIQGNLYELEKFFPEENFDLLSFYHVFEHIINPKSYLEYITKFLKPNGYMFVTVPNILSDDFIKQGDKWSYLHVPAHISYFNCKSLDEIFLNNTNQKEHFKKIFQSTFPGDNMKEGEAVTAIYRIIK